MKYTYLMVNLGAFIVPFIFSFHPKLQFYKKWKTVLIATFFTFCTFVPWDIFFTHLAVWGFNKDYLLGYYFFNLPLEELMFFVCIPYSCLFTYHCFDILIKKDYFLAYKKTISISLFTLLAFFAFFAFDKKYTATTAALLCGVIFLLEMVFKVKWLSRFYFAYLILLIPFLIVNGILTGTGLDKPVVWYDNLENLSVRILTIPVEDVFYGMLMIILSVSVYEYFRIKKRLIIKHYKTFCRFIRLLKPLL
ncbi:MAG: lycopene cyclase domain-containing protein [Sphingobacteriaceae bacterium]|nr:lycopene cyclase domain-containing protein [Sphingobacteriaceae bacterium]